MNTRVETVAAIHVRGVGKRFGETPVLRDIDLDVAPGAVVALLGPSGCGKTTLLRSIAGLERVDAGEIRLGDRVVSGPTTHQPPEKRRVGMVFQDWALFPHLTVAQNVAYGLPRGDRKGTRVDEVLRLVDLTGLGDRQPATLSGGQQQRVALARALAPRPRVLLLDEPFSNLDTSLRVQVRTEVHQLLTELDVTTIFVTHDQEEAFVLGDEVAVMDGGRLVQQATPAGLYARPATPWVATFVGDANLVTGEADGKQAATPVGSVPLAAAAEGAVQVVLRPEELALDPIDDPTPPRTSASASDRIDGSAPAGTSASDRIDGSAWPAHSGNGHNRVDSSQAQPGEGHGNGINGSQDSCGRSAQSGAALTGTVELREYYGHDTVYLVRPDGGEPLRVRAGSVPRFTRGDRVVLRYVGPPAVAYPAT